MEAYRRVYDSRHLQVDCQEPGSALEPPTLCNLVWATFIFARFSSLHQASVQNLRSHRLFETSYKP